MEYNKIGDHQNGIWIGCDGPLRDLVFDLNQHSGLVLCYLDQWVIHVTRIWGRRGVVMHILLPKVLPTILDWLCSGATSIGSWIVKHCWWGGCRISSQISGTDWQCKSHSRGGSWVSCISHEDWRWGQWLSCWSLHFHVCARSTMLLFDTIMLRQESWICGTFWVLAHCLLITCSQATLLKHTFKCLFIVSVLLCWSIRRGCGLP